MKTFDELKKLGILKNHNISTYLEMQELFDEGKNRVGIVQATGTGKSFVAFQFLYDYVLSVNKQVYASNKLFEKGKYMAKRAVVLEPRQGIVFRFNELCEKLCRELNVPFDDVIVARYDQLKLLTDEELQLLDFDYIILDEFHRLGAKGRGSVTKRLLESNPDAKVLGLTATPIRYLDKKRDMGDELFGDDIVRGMNLAEAIQSGILPNPEYIMAVRSYEETAKIIEDKIKLVKEKQTRELYENELKELRRHPEFAKGLKETFERKIQKKNGKFIAFCTDTEKLLSLKREIENGLFDGVNQNVKIYQITYRDKKEEVERKIKEFEDDHSDCFKIMLAVDMFNEGIHISDVDGCFLFRPTISPEIYTQQIGRVLSVRDDKNFYPQIFDIVNNMQSYEKIILAFEAEKAKGAGRGFGGDGDDQSILPFEITGSDEDFFAKIMELSDRVSASITDKNQWLRAAGRYAKEHGNLNIPSYYIDQETELKLGSWLYHTRRAYNRDKTLIDEKIVKRLSELDKYWFEYSLDKFNAERDKKIIDGVRAWTEINGCVPIPKGTMSPVDQSFNLAQHITTIKQSLKGKAAVNYSKELIDEILSINPNALQTKEDKNAERDKKIIDGVRAWTEINGCVPIPQETMSPIDQSFKLGKQITKIKLFLKGKAAVNYSKELIDEILSINPNALQTKEDKNAERDKKIIDGVRAWTEINGCVPIPQETMSPIDQSFKLGSQIGEIKLFLKGNKRVEYSQELIDEILSINPNALQTKNSRISERDVKIINGVKAWTEINGHVKIPYDAMSPIDETFKLGSQISQIKLFLKGIGKAKYSQELIDEINEINPEIFKSIKTKYHELID